MGSCTKGGELKYSISTFYKFTQNKSEFYIPIFDSMSPVEIRKYFIDDEYWLMMSEKEEDAVELANREKLHLFFGSQFSNDGCFIQFLYNNNLVIVIYEPPRTLNAKKYLVEYDEFCGVFDQYVSFCKNNRLVTDF